jgi:hypothetical protein
MNVLPLRLWLSHCSGAHGEEEDLDDDKVLLQCLVTTVLCVSEEPEGGASTDDDEEEQDCDDHVLLRCFDDRALLYVSGEPEDGADMVMTMFCCNVLLKCYDDNGVAMCVRRARRWS